MKKIDIAALKILKRKATELQAKAPNIVLIDKLTGVNNKIALDNNFIPLTREMLNREKLGITSSLAYGDVSNLKAINDLYGHDVGDIGMKRIIHAVKFCLREDAYIARAYDGDEFIIFLPNTNKEEAEFIRKRINDTVEVVLGEIEIAYPEIKNLSFALGISDTREIPIPEEFDDKSIEESYEKLKKIAEDKMYADKRLTAKGMSEEKKDLRIVSSNMRDCTFLGLDYQNDDDFEEMIARQREARQRYLGDSKRK